MLDSRRTWAQKYELDLTAGRVERFDFEQRDIKEWKTVDGRWSVEEARDAPSGKRVLVQRAVNNTYNVIVAPGGPYNDLDVSVRFKPISGNVDASGGIVFRFSPGHYYIVRANVLENNVVLYKVEKGVRLSIAPKGLPSRAYGVKHTVPTGRWRRCTTG